MRRGRIFIFLALILIIGLAVAALVFRQFFGAGSTAAETAANNCPNLYCRTKYSSGRTNHR